MSNLEIIQKLCGLLDDAQGIIAAHAELLALYGIATDDGQLERERVELLAEIEGSV
jgi:hypothetical protein